MKSRMALKSTPVHCLFCLQVNFIPLNVLKFCEKCGIIFVVNFSFPATPSHPQAGGYFEEGGL